MKLGWVDPERLCVSLRQVVKCVCGHPLLPAPYLGWLAGPRWTTSGLKWDKAVILSQWITNYQHNKIYRNYWKLYKFTWISQILLLLPHYGWGYTTRAQRDCYIYNSFVELIHGEIRNSFIVSIGIDLWYVKGSINILLLTIFVDIRKKKLIYEFIYQYVKRIIGNWRNLKTLLMEKGQAYQ